MREYVFHNGRPVAADALRVDCPACGRGPAANRSSRICAGCGREVDTDRVEVVDDGD